MSLPVRRGTRAAVAGRVVDAAIAGGVFRQEGEYWTIEYAGTLIRLRDSKGLRYLAQLLRHPQQPFAASDLVSSSSAKEPESRHSSPAERARLAVTKRVRAAIRNITEYHPGLGYHLSVAIKTGTHCVYLPDPQRPCVWNQ